jgi:hypothetical protein
MMAEHKPADGAVFPIQFSAQAGALGVRRTRRGDPGRTCALLGLEVPRPALFVSGGADALDAATSARIGAIVRDGVARFAQDRGVTVFDGGTDAGVMRLLGEARQAAGYGFPLVGVAPAGRVRLPGDDRGEEATELHPGHSHFVLVEGDTWGDESGTIVKLTRAVAGFGAAPMAGVLINGGRVALHDVYLATARGRYPIPILVIDGSGRSADQIAAAARGGQADAPRVRAIIESGAITVVPASTGPERVYAALGEVFATRPSIRKG